jgi:hypothetical protein
MFHRSFVSQAETPKPETAHVSAAASTFTSLLKRDHERTQELLHACLFLFGDRTADEMEIVKVKIHRSSEG